MGEEIAVDWALVRDTIRVNDALLAEIRAEMDFRRLSPTATLALVAREIVHDPGYVLAGLAGHPLVLVAQDYHGQGGGISADGPGGSGGAEGAAGASGQGQSGRRGGPGGPGGNGQPGGAASTVTVLAANLTDLTVSARGGPGGAGGTGGTGGHGHDAPARPNKPDIDPPEPGPGGPGGNGGVGAAGGPGALILIETVTQGNVRADGSGGDVGRAGSAGRGGRGGRRGGNPTPVEDPGPDGAPGTPGPGPGPAVQPVFVTHSEADWWLLAKLRLGGRAKDWANYRTNVGEFFFRAFAPGNPDRAGHRDKAVQEFRRALALDPDQARASELLRYSASNLSPIGQPYNLDIMPDFPHFEDVVTDYDEIVKSLYDNALSLLLSVVDTGQKAARLGADIGRVQDMAAVLGLERKAADLGVEAAKGKAKAIDQEISATNAALDAVRDEMVHKRMEFPPGNDLGPLISTAIAVAAAVSAVYTGGASIVAFLAAANLMMKGVGAVEGFDVNTGTTADGEQLIDKWDWKDPGKPKLKDSAKDVGGLRELLDTSKKFIDAGRATTELMSAKVDGKLESRERDLLVRLLDLGRQKGLQLLEVSQKAVLAAAAAGRVAANEADLARLRGLEGDWASDIAALSDIARRLIRQTQAYVDVLLRFGFYAHRALDLFTLNGVTSAQFSFDIGYLHPDDVENTFQPLARGDDSRVIPLLGQYTDSWARMPGLVALRAFYDDYQRSLQHAVRFVTVATPDVLASLRRDKTATFSVPLTDFPGTWSEFKVERVDVALLGATASDPAVLATVQHGGGADNRLRGGGGWTVGGQPVSAVVEAGFDKRGPGTPAPAEARQAFWGRSPATTWRVTLEPTSVEQSNLDLTGLTALYVTIRYAFYTAPSAPAGPVVPAMAVAADYDGDRKPDTARWDPADGVWHVQPSAGGPERAVPWGQAGDMPVPADYDADGSSELAVYRPADRTLLARPFAGGPTSVYLWRTADYRPDPADHRGMDLLANTFRLRANALTAEGRHEEAVAAQLEALAGYRQLAGLDPAYRASVAQTLVMLGAYQSKTARHDDAIASCREAVDGYRALGDKPMEAWALGNLAAMYRAAGRYPEAVQAQQEAVAAYRTLAKQDPAYRGSLAMQLVFLGMTLQQAGRHEEAVVAAREAVDTYRGAADEPNTAWALGNLGTRLQGAQRFGESADAWRESRDIYQRLASTDPAYRVLWANSALRYAEMLAAAGRRPDALPAAEEAVRLYTELSAAEPGKYAGETAAATKLRDSLAAG